MAKSSLSILVCSCDHYHELWEVKFDNLHQKVLNMSEKIFITNNEITVNKKYEYLNIRRENSWTDCIKQALDKIDTDYVFVTFDDLIFENSIDMSRIKNIIKDYDDYDIIKLENRISFWEYKLHGDIATQPLRSPYRLSLVNAVIKRQRLIEYLRDDMTAWEFETQPPSASKNLKIGVLCKSRLKSFNGVVKGRVRYHKDLNNIKFKNITRATYLQNFKLFIKFQMYDAYVFAFPSFLKNILTEIRHENYRN